MYIVLVYNYIYLHNMGCASEEGLVWPIDGKTIYGQNITNQKFTITHFPHSPCFSTLFCLPVWPKTFLVGFPIDG